MARVNGNPKAQEPRTRRASYVVITSGKKGVKDAYLEIQVHHDGDLDDVFVGPAFASDHVVIR